MLNKIILMGRLTRDPELRQTQSGTKRRSHEVIVDSLYFAGSKRQSEERAEPGDFREAPEGEEGELPF